MPVYRGIKPVPKKRKYRKRRGRKKKKEERPKNRFKLILSRNGREIKKLGVYKTLKEVYTDYLERIRASEKNVVFPMRFINSGKIKECKDELIILKVKEEGDSDTTLLRNEYGEFVPFGLKDRYDENSPYGKYSTKSWVIVDKKEILTEETFWVFGFHPTEDRKDFRYIYNNFVIDKAKDKETVIRIVVYLNKLIIDYGNDMNIVFCKNVSDALRLYTEIEKNAMVDKLKNIIWNQQVNNRALATYWLDRLERKTGFKRHKLKRNSLRP